MVWTLNGECCSIESQGMFRWLAGRVLAMSVSKEVSRRWLRWGFWLGRILDVEDSSWWIGGIGLL